MSRQKKTRRKKINKKPLIAGTALVLAGALGAGAFLGTSLSVQASAVMMPGIETIVGETSQQEPFRILEIVDDKKEAELGWYVSGQEPYVKLYTYTYKEKNDQGQEEEKTLRFSTLEEGLSMLPTKELREEFAGNFRYQKNEQGETVLDQDGNPVIEASELKDVRAYCYQGEDGTLEESFPLSYTPYQETYFLTDQDQAENWSRVEFSQIREDTLTGSYEENPAGTGDYTKQQQTYYPVRGDYTETDTESGTEVKLDQKENTGRLFRENIQSFIPAESEEESPGGNAPYHLVFQPVSNEEFNKNLAALLDPETASQDNPIRSAYDYSVRTDTNGDGKITSADAFGYGYFENKYEALTVKIMEHILPTETGKAPLYLFPGENPQVDGISGFQPTNSQLSQQDASAAEAPASEGEAVFDSGETTELPDSEFHEEEGLDIFSDMSFFHTIEMENHTYQAMEQAFSDSAVFSEEQSMEASQPENGADVFVDGETVSGGSENLQPDYEPGNPAEGQNNGADRTDSGAPGELFVGEGKNPDAAEPEAQGQDPEAGDPAGNSQGDQEPVLLEGISEFATAGTQSNPKVYIADLIEEYPYYRYTSIGDLQYIKENAVLYDEKYMPDSNNEVNISISKDGRYLYWTQDPETENWNSQEIMIVTGRQPVAYENLTKLPENYEGSYYYRVAEAYFCCKKTEPEAGGALAPDNYQYTGWYYPVYPENQEQYLPVEDASGDEATYYISQAEYEFTPGTGNYDFVPSGEGETQLVKVDHLFYQGGYQNHDWLKQYVFHLTRGQEGSPEREEWDRFAITVDTVTAKEFQNLDTEGTPLLPLTEYDLVYVNGTLDQVSAEKLVYTEKEDGTRTPRKIPCMINQAKAKAQDSGINQAFAGFVKDESIDVDQHYVNTYVYFFKNTYGAADSEEAFSLFNLNFSTDFHLNQGEGGTDLGDGSSPSQVQGFEEILDYIKKENQYREIASAGGNLSDGTGSPETGEKIPPLTEELSQARAVEYILNYQYKRKAETKETLRVLEIQPENTSPYLTDRKISSWLGYEGEDVKSAISVQACCSRPAEGNVGGPELTLDGNVMTRWHSALENETGYHPENHFLEITLQEAVQGQIAALRYYARGDDPTSGNGILETYQVDFYSEDNKLLHSETNVPAKYENTSSGRYITIAIPENPAVKTIKLTFLKAKGDNNYASCGDLDVVYKTDKIEQTFMTASEFAGHIEDVCSEYDMIYIGNSLANPTNNLITGGDGLCYTHVGAGRKVDVSKDGISSLKHLMGQLDIEYDSETSVDGKKRFLPYSQYGEHGAGYFRGSGNDMTLQECEMLLDFVKSGYPVILGAELVTEDGRINTDKVDSASYYYQFMKEALSYKNVMREPSAAGDGELVNFYANLAKPEIVFDGEEGKPKEPQRLNDAPGDQYGYIDGELKYVFSVKNDSDAVPAISSYDCKLYLDLNFDGRFSEMESQDNYMVLRDESGAVLSRTEGHYELRSGKTYTLTRTIPSDYLKLIAWKLEVSNNSNSYIRTSQTGYAKQDIGVNPPQELNVLQLVPEKCTWTLNQDVNFQNRLNQVQDFKIQITSMTVTEYGKLTRAEAREKLSNIQMLIIGFADTYQNIPNQDGQVNEILDYIRSGKSVIFAHDTTSYLNYNYDEMYPWIAKENYNNSIDKTTVFEDKFKTWGLSMNHILRFVVGMDRYGITSDVPVDGIGNSMTISDLLKQGKELTSDTVDFQMLLRAAGDIAYQRGNKSKSYAQTQSYTNLLLQPYSLGDHLTSKATKLNDGAITQYPYRMDEELNIASTHGQYYQLALEKDYDNNGRSDGASDIVVWYCLKDNVYSDSPNDARNNYYFYSNGNVIYTGAGHSAVANDEEINLFINAIVAAANVTAVQPQASFVKELNPMAETETLRYYETDQFLWSETESNVLEQDMDFYLNVKDYNMVSADLSMEDLEKQDMTVEFFVENENGEKKPLNQYIPYLTMYGQGAGMIEKREDGKFHLNQNNAYGFTLRNIEEYLRTSDQKYSQNSRLLVEVTSTVYLYGSPKVNTSVAYLDLKQRQLFELD